MEWQPIETAPKDGSVFLGFATKDDKNGFAVIYFDEELEEFCDAVFAEKLFYFTHWTPLPAPPMTDVAEK